MWFRLVWLAALLIATTLSADAAWAQAAVSEHTTDEHTDAADIQFAYPQIGVPADDAMLKDWAQSLLADFKASVASRTNRESPYFARLAYTVTRNDETAVVVLFTYSFYTGGAHPNSTQTSFNFLMPDGARVFVPDLLGEDGVKRVSDIAIADLTARLGATGYVDPNWIRTGAGPYADNFEAFEWLPSEVVLHFDPYAVASYADGPQVVHIPLSRLRDLMRADPRAPLPSFDCALASTAIENAICSDQALAQLDRRVAQAYAMRLRLETLGGVTATVRGQQMEWLAQRDADCADLAGQALVGCLDGEYAQRLVALRSFG